MNCVYLNDDFACFCQLFVLLLTAVMGEDGLWAHDTMTPEIQTENAFAVSLEASKYVR